MTTSSFLRVFALVSNQLSQIQNCWLRFDTSLAPFAALLPII